MPLITRIHPPAPLVEVTLLVEDRMADLIAEQIDVAIRAAQLEDLRWHASWPTTPRPGGCPSYLERAGIPAPEDLAQHDVPAVDARQPRVRRVAAGHGRQHHPGSRAGPHPRQRWHGLAATACAGAGITLIDRLLVEQELADGTLVELLTPLQPSARPTAPCGLPGPAMAGAQHLDLCGVFAVPAVCMRV